MLELLFTCYRNNNTQKRAIILDKNEQKFFYSTNISKYCSNILVDHLLLPKTNIHKNEQIFFIQQTFLFDNLTIYYFTINKNQITIRLLKGYTYGHCQIKTKKLRQHTGFESWDIFLLLVIDYSIFHRI